MILAMNLDLIKRYYINKRATHWHRTQNAYCENQMNGAHLYLIIRNKGLLFHPAGRAQKRLLRNMIKRAIPNIKQNLHPLTLLFSWHWFHLSICIRSRPCCDPAAVAASVSETNYFYCLPWPYLEIWFQNTKPKTSTEHCIRSRPSCDPAAVAASVSENSVSWLLVSRPAAWLKEARNIWNDRQSASWWANDPVFCVWGGQAKQG